MAKKTETLWNYFCIVYLIPPDCNIRVSLKRAETTWVEVKVHFLIIYTSTAIYGETNFTNKHRVIEEKKIYFFNEVSTSMNWNVRKSLSNFIWLRVTSIGWLNAFVGNDASLFSLRHGKFTLPYNQENWMTTNVCYELKYRFSLRSVKNIPIQDNFFMYTRYICKRLYDDPYYMFQIVGELLI